MDYLFDSIMTAGYKYSDTLFKLIYDRQLRPAFYNTIVKANPKNIKKEDYEPYKGIKWISNEELDGIKYEEGEDGLKLHEIIYLKQSIKFFKVYFCFTCINLTAFLAFLVNSEKIKRDLRKRKTYSVFILFLVFFETPYLIYNYFKQENKNYLMEVLNRELEKYEIFYKL
jgi:hypothetical protein